MALKINAQIETDSGFTSDKVLAFLDIYLPVGGQWVNIRYYESPTAFKAGREEINISSLPNSIHFKIPNNVFWGEDGKNLAMAIHNGVKNKIEEITGPNTVTIIQDLYA